MRVIVFGAFLWVLLCSFPKFLHASGCGDSLNGDQPLTEIALDLIAEKKIRLIKIIDQNSSETILALSTLNGGEGYIHEFADESLESDYKHELSFNELGDILAIRISLPPGNYHYRYFAEDKNGSYTLVGTNTVEITEPSTIETVDSEDSEIEENNS